MKTELTITAKPRTATGKQAESLRRTGLVPAVVYGNKIKNLNLEIDKKEFKKVFAQSGESTLVTLAVESDKPRTVLVHDVQHDILTEEPIHVDFYEVDMSKKITAHVALNFSGESTAVKDMGGTLLKNITELEVECLPADLPHDILVDTSKLKTFEDIILVSDLTIDREKIKLSAHPEDVVAKVTPPRTEEELKELEERPEGEDVTAVEGVVKEEKPEGEEGGKDKQEEKKPEEEKK